MVKLTPALMDLIPSRLRPPLPLPELVDSEEEYIVEGIINSRMFRCQLQYSVKWEGYGVEGNTWEYLENVNNAPEKIAEFHAKNPAAPHHIHAMTFRSIPFHPIALAASTLS